MKKKKSFLNYLTLGLVGGAVSIGTVSQTPYGQNLAENIGEDVKIRYSINYQKNIIENVYLDMKKFSSIFDKLDQETKDFFYFLSKISNKKLSKEEINYIILSFSKITPKIYLAIQRDDLDFYNRNLQIFYNSYYVKLHNSVQNYLKQLYGLEYEELNSWLPLTNRNK